MDKGQLLKQVRNHTGTDCYMIFIAILKEDIQTLREMNDTAEGSQVLHNQGAIAYIKKLIREMRPTGLKTPGYTGAFDE